MPVTLSRCLLFEEVLLYTAALVLMALSKCLLLQVLVYMAPFVLVALSMALAAGIG